MAALGKDKQRIWPFALINHCFLYDSLVLNGMTTELNLFLGVHQLEQENSLELNLSLLILIKSIYCYSKYIKALQRMLIH